MDPSGIVLSTRNNNGERDGQGSCAYSRSSGGDGEVNKQFQPTVISSPGGKLKGAMDLHFPP